jgi:hypothetical protein
MFGFAFNGQKSESPFLIKHLTMLFTSPKTNRMKKSKHFALLFLSLLLLASCSPSKSLSELSPADRDGTSFEKAVIVTSVKAEYEWLAIHYPGYKMKMQSLVDHKKKTYDILSIVTAAGLEKDFYFDISEFFGKY